MGARLCRAVSLRSGAVSHRTVRFACPMRARDVRKIIKTKYPEGA